MEWQVFEQVCGPLPDLRSDYHAASVNWTQAMLHGRDPKRRSQKFDMDDFRLFAPPKAPKVLGWEESKAQFMSVTGAVRPLEAGEPKPWAEVVAERQKAKQRKKRPIPPPPEPRKPRKGVR